MTKILIEFEQSLKKYLRSKLALRSHTFQGNRRCVYRVISRRSTFGSGGITFTASWRVQLQLFSGSPPPDYSLLKPVRGGLMPPDFRRLTRSCAENR